MDKEDKATLYRHHYTWIELSLASDRLTEWEHNFLESVKKYLQDKGSLTPKQVAILERIYAEKTD